MRTIKQAIKQTRFGQIMRVYLRRYIYNTRYRRKLQDLDFPPEVWIENTNCCNARCVMCPRDKHTRPQGFMDFTLYKKLIKEIAFYKQRVKRVHLHNFGEPLLDKELPRRVRFAKEYGIRHTYFVTNGAMLTPEMSRDVIEAGLDEFKISFYGTDPNTYNTTMRGLDFYTTIENVENFFKVRESLNRKKPKVIIQYLPQESNRARVNDFVKIFHGIIDEAIGDRMNIFSLHNYGDGRESHTTERDICTTCDYPWRTMVILHDGRVALCCLDYNGAQIAGDTRRSSIRQIWNGPVFAKVRRDFKNLNYKDYPVCLKCDRTR